MAPIQAERGGGGGVRIVSRRLVRPDPCASPEQVAETMHLTPWDLCMMAVDYIQKGVVLPKPPPGGEHFVEHLASSFARALARFYPLAGRLAVAGIDDGESPETRRISVSLCCNDEGAEFVHAAAHGVTVADIAGSMYVPRVVWSFFPLDGMVGADAAVDARLPILAAQVTELADGVFVAMSLSHGVADGFTFWQFFSTWSEMSRGAGGLSTPSPVLDRWFIDTTTSPIPIPLPFASPEEIIGRRAMYPPVEECFFHFTAESIKNLKAKANAGGGAMISSLQSLLAHLWRGVCRARRLSPEVDTKYAIPVGCRGRVKGLATGYVGNAVAPVTARANAGEVFDKGIGWTAWQLNRAVASVDDASVRDMLVAWPENPSFLRMADLQDAGGMGTSGSPRFDVFGNDFGWGKPVAVRSGAGNKLDGKMTVYEGRGGGGAMALEVCLLPETLARLVADEEFMSAVSSPPA